MRLLPRILADEDELDRQPETTDANRDQARSPAFPPAPARVWIALVAAGALIPRLVYLFLFTDPENAGHGFTDAYHHWQIAYLTKEIGLSHGPRLWDLRGWEYYWGLLHPALMNVLFFVTGSADIVQARLLSAAFGTVVVVLIFTLCHRYWGYSVAIPSAVFAALAPANVFNDTAGLAEPIAVALVLLGIWLAPSRGFWGGVAWGLAAMARAEAWLFGAGMVVAWLLGSNRMRGRWWLVGAWILAMGLYAKFLLDQTGNLIYPVYWNFQFIFFGAIDPTPVISATDRSLAYPLLGATFGSLLALAWALWKRPTSYLLLVYGFGYSAYSFATYLKVDAWKERRFELPLDFAAILACVFLFKVVPSAWPGLARLSPVVAALALIGIQVFWIPIQTAYAATEPGFRAQVQSGRDVGAVYNDPAYRGGVIGVPGDNPTLIYTMIRYGGVPGDRVTSEFYDPFYYLPAGYHYPDHRDVAGPLLQCWMSSTHMRLLLMPAASAFDHSVPDYQAFMADHPDWFVDTQARLGDGMSLFAVHVPPLSGSECAQAARKAP